MTVLDPKLFVRERFRQRKSAVDMAIASDIDPRRYFAIERGADATDEEVESIATALGVAVHDIDRSN